MRTWLPAIAAVISLWHADTSATAPATRPAGKSPKAFVVVFNFHTAGTSGSGTSAAPLSQRPLGVQLADSARLRLARHTDCEVVDRLTTEEFADALPASTGVEEVIKLLTGSLGANVGLYGTVEQKGASVRAEVRCVDLTSPGKPKCWKMTFSDATERASAVIAREIVEALRGEAEWAPPQYGDEAEPKNFGKPLNKNGDFESGSDGWDKPDNAGTFIAGGPDRRGKLLRVRTDLARDPWLAYRRALLLGKADPARPPKIARDTGYGSVAGLEGVHYCSEFIKATRGQRYWLLADHSGPGGAKVFVKGFRRTESAPDGLPESSLAELGLTPDEFARLPEAKRRELIAADAKKNPQRYLRECWRWYLNCAGSRGKWTHFAAPFPPRGGLPEGVEFLQIQIYSYWPPGVYLWDKVHLYKDPNQKAPLPEEKPRTPNPPDRRAGAGEVTEKAPPDR